MRLRLLVLALGTFALGTGSFVFAGLLEGVARDLSVSVGAAGNLVTVFAVTYAVSSPVLVTLAGGVAPRRILVAAMAVFALANAAAVFAPTFGLLLACRVLAAFGAAVFTPTALAVAAGLAPPEGRGRAISFITGGLTVSFVLGIPLGSIIGTYAGWRMTFVMVAALGVVAMVGIRSLLPPVEAQTVVSLRERIDALKQPAVVAALCLTTLGLMGGFVVFTYVSPLLAEITGFGGAGVSGLLFLFGVAALFGNGLGGYGADHIGYAPLMATILALLALSLLGFSLLVALAGTALVLPATIAALAVWGVAGFALNPLQQYRVAQLAPRTRNIALSLNASAIYLGQGAGAGLGALALGHGSLATLGWTGALCAVCALVVLLFTTKARRRPETVPERG
ncbi:MFS transporter [Rubrobacter tropicus]|uniref:MFS transporter n=1 Tax=Rubrobacter tropicus TaxID=2653851 RepID=A0A6G8QDF5_9ACTN|nr:MFS transporter [Rubrobacter tropicus]QIN84287.1 MFS transporter [Rubrobacter tropicus]